MKGYVQVLMLATLVFTLKVELAKATAQYASKTEAEMQNTLAHIWKKHEFAQLEEFYSQLAQEKGRFASGNWKLRLFHQSNVLCMGEDNCDDLLEQWLKTVPTCTACRIARAETMHSRAWKARGRGYTPDKGDSSMNQYRNFTKLSFDELQATGETAMKDPFFQEQRLRIAHEMGLPKSVTKQLYEEALTVEPYWRTLHETQLIFSLPRWGGVPGDIRLVAERAAAATKEKRGETYYALLGQTAYQWEGEATFTTHGFSWPRMKQGFEDLLSQFPQRLNLAAFAKTAVAADDRETARELFKRLGTFDRSLQPAFRNEEQFKEWKAFAFSEKKIVKIPLIEAVKQGNQSEIERLLKVGADINEQDSSFVSPLGYAVSFHPELVDFLLKHGADVRRGRAKGSSYIFAAAAQGESRLVKLLIQAGAQPNTQEGNTTPLLEAARENYHETVKVLLDSGADPNSPGNSGLSPLMVAAQANALESARELLKDKRTRVSEVDRIGMTALHHAAAAGQTPMIFLLLDFGADPTLSAPEKGTAADIAEQNGYSSIQEFLNYEITQAQGQTPFMVAVRKGQTDTVENLLSSGRVNLNETTKDNTSALGNAVRFHPELVDLLLSKGASPDFGLIDGKPLLFVAVENNDPVLAEKLASKAMFFEGKFSSINEAIRKNSPELVRAVLLCKNIKAASTTVETQISPLQLAIKLNAIEAAEELLKTPSLNINKKLFNPDTKTFESALTSARAAGNQRMVALLEAHGAKD